MMAIVSTGATSGIVSICRRSADESSKRLSQQRFGNQPKM